jgi:hypothetical protein
MRPNALGQVRATAGAEMLAVAEKVRAELMLPEAFSARGARRHRVAKAVPEENRTLLMAEVAGSPAVEVRQMIAVNLNGIVWGHPKLAPRALVSHSVCSHLIR